MAHKTNGSRQRISFLLTSTLFSCYSEIALSSSLIQHVLNEVSGSGDGPPSRLAGVYEAYETVWECGLNMQERFHSHSTETRVKVHR